MQPGVVEGAVLELHGARAAAGAGPGVNTPSLTTTWADTSGEANDGTLNTFAGTEASGWDGDGTAADPYRLVFDGGSDYVSLGNVAFGANHFTIEAWIDLTGADTHNPVFACYDGGEPWNTDAGLCVWLTNGLLRIQMSDGASHNLDTGYAGLAGSDLRGDGLHHVAIVWDGSFIRAYVDGSATGTAARTYGAGSPAAGALVGSAWVGKWRGGIAVVRAYPLDLSAADVAQNYATGPAWVVPPPPPRPRATGRHARSTRRSLLVGSDTLGWQELGGKAVLGQMTKAMPGGDGSLEFALYGDDAWKARNVLVPGESEVKLVVGGEPVYGGVLVTDPVRHRLSCQSVVECAASGPYGLAARDGRYGYIGIDNDPEQWRQWRSASNHAQRFTVKTDDSVLELRADSDRKYASGDCVQMQYRIHDGLTLAQKVYGIQFDYYYDFPSTDWAAEICPSSSGWTWDGGSVVWASSGASSGGWVTGQQTHFGTWFDTPYGTWSVVVRLTYSGATGSPASDPVFRMRNHQLVGRSTPSPGGPSYVLYLSDVLSDLADELGVTNARIDSAFASYALDQFVARYPTDVTEVMRQAIALYTGPVEAFFDLDPTTLTRRFTARPRPADTALAAENRLWVVGGRGGEDTDGLVRDWEATPDQVQVMYAVKDDATLPDGTVKAVTYPGGLEPSWPFAEVVDITSDKPVMSEETAERYANAVYEYRQSNRYSGDVAVMQTAHDERGSDVPTYKMRPGDRLTALDRDDTDRFGETLYVQATSYDWQTGRGSMTVGNPFDPLEATLPGLRASGHPLHDHVTGRPSRVRPHVRSGVA